jgi:hypothetical protein
MASLSWRPRHAARTDRPTGRRPPGGADAKSRLRAVTTADLDPAPTGAATQPYEPDDAVPYRPVHLDASGGDPQWTEPQWVEPEPWTQPTTPWNGPTNWRGSGYGWQSGAKNRGRSRWRTAQMLFRRRYNTAALVTIVAVATVLVLLAALPIDNHNRSAAAAPAAGPATSAATLNTKGGTYRIVTYEAEATGNTLAGSASVSAYDGASGGQLVRAIGNWGGTKGPGALRFNNVEVARGGPYVLTFYFVNIKASATRTVVVTASGSQSNLVTVVSDSACCSAQPMVVFLSKGKNSITFSNTGGEAPAIDKITIKEPVS